MRTPCPIQNDSILDWFPGCDLRPRPPAHGNAFPYASSRETWLAAAAGPGARALVLVDRLRARVLAGRGGETAAVAGGRRRRDLVPAGRARRAVWVIRAGRVVGPGLGRARGAPAAAR